MVRRAYAQVGNWESGENPEQPSLLCLIDIPGHCGNEYHKSDYSHILFGKAVLDEKKRSRIWYKYVYFLYFVLAESCLNILYLDSVVLSFHSKKAHFYFEGGMRLNGNKNGRRCKKTAGD